MALIGQGAQPVGIDYSRWADMTARSSQATAAAIGGLADKLGGIVEDRREKKDQIKAAEAKGKAVKELFGDQGGFLDSFLATMGDEELPLSERAAIAGDINDVISAGIDKFKFSQELDLDERRLKLAEDAGRFEIDQAKKEADRQAKQIAESEQTQAFMAPQVLNQVLQATAAAEKSGQPVMIPSNRLQEALNAASPAQQMSIAQAAMAGLPKKSAGQLMEIPVTQNGQPAKVMARYDEAAGRFNIVPVVQAGELGSSLPATLAPYASTFEEAGAKYGVDPKFLAAISMHETANGTSNAFRNKNNAMGISDRRGPTTQASVEDSIFKMARSLSRPGGHYEGRDTIAEIGAKYAPKGAGNDPRNLNKFWPGKVAEYYAGLGGDPSAPVRITPGAVTAKPAAQKTDAEIKKEELEIAKLEREAEAEKKKAVDAAAAASANVDKLRRVADKYTEVKNGVRVPKAELRDVTGPFAAVGKFVDKYADPESLAKKNELARFVEADLLEATKDLKPVSEDEMKLLMSRRPAIDSPAEVWAQYMDEILTFIASKSPGSPQAPPPSSQDRLRQRLGR